MGTLHEGQCKFLIKSLEVHLRMRTVTTDKQCMENQNTHVMFDSFSENHAVYDLKWNNIVEPGRPQMRVRRIRIACWISKATNTRSEYVLCFAFQLQL